MEKETFYEKVYEVVRLIPAGRVSSYGAIAAFLGTKGSSRMVGYAMNAAGTAFPPVPAHRVLNRNGILSGRHHFRPPGLMQQLLESEGITVTDDKIENFKQKFWDPAIELYEP
jgi:methylated-DNA-protein-cysteine methyltransferase related protein